jgi:hypothetical protein
MTQAPAEPGDPGPAPGGRRSRPVVVGAVLVLVVVGAVGAVATWRADGEMTDVFAMEVGDCVNGISDTGHDTEEFASTPVVPCSEPHEAEVITSFVLDGHAYPGLERVVAESQERCTELMAVELRSAPRPVELVPFYFYPTSQSWEHADDRTVHCLAMPAHGPTTGSLTDPERTP